MSVVAWILNWPPSRGTVALFFILTAVSAGSVVVFDDLAVDDRDGNVTVEGTDLTVSLNDEVELPDGGNGSVQTCMGIGTPGDTLSIIGTVTLEVPHASGLQRSDGREPVLVVSLAHTNETITKPVSRTGRVKTQVFGVLDDDETLSPGETETLELRVRHQGAIVANTTRTITVGTGTWTYNC